ncbi:hypothetical protein Pcinc_014657 [Petrolisthes cinctipes]|uniref:C2H2-type domain-containing protein n=1 Tax=Petrolisthes cinctipes TaxID=88211 RepID=A0AAE1KP01_PETCI|nr:hypothetical protein Pcinc_014657 [Petrolisthes cinctipes]
MRVVRTKTVYGVGLGELCRLCGTQEDRMLHLDDTFSILGAASSIIRLLGSIAVYLKVQDDCEVLMPKRLCVTCLNMAVDIQTFVNSGLNFQKTTIRQLFPDAKVEEIFSTSFVTESEALPKNLVAGEVPQFVKQDTLTDDITGKQSQGILNSCSVEKDESELPRQETSTVQDHENVPRQSLETECTLDPKSNKEIVLNTGNSTTDSIATNPKCQDTSSTDVSRIAESLKRANKQGYECSECKVVVLCKSSLRRHMTTVHAASNKYTCPHCSKGFNNYQNYQGHVRRHTGERPYGCPHCNKTFTTTKALTRHTATHQATRAHKCPECNKGFLEMCDLKKHLRRHQQRKQQQRIRSRENATPNTTPVDTEMNSINLMVLNDPLLFDQSHQLLDSPGSKVTEVILQHDKLESCKEVNTEPVLEPNSLLEDGNKDRVQEPPSLELPSEGVLTSSTLLSPPPSVSLLAETQVMAPIPEPLDPTQVLNSADIHVHQVVSDGESEVTLPSQDSSGCRSVTDATTMVVLSSIHTPSEFMSVPAAAAAVTAAGPENTSETSNSVIDGDGHQEGQRILSHATW